MTSFPRTVVGGVSLPRLIIGTNWFLGYSHTSLAKNNFIKEYQTRDNIARIIQTFLEYDIDAVMMPESDFMNDAIKQAEDATGKAVIRIVTPHFNVKPDAPTEEQPEVVVDRVKAMGATLCFPHQCTTDALLDLLNEDFRDMHYLVKLIRDRDMIPGLSTHSPHSIIVADKTDLDVETYIQLYNSSGFLMQVEVDWIMRVIHQAKKPVVTIKPLAAGKILPPVALAFVWNTLRDCDMVTIGTTTPDEARECIELSMDYLDRRLPEHELQVSRSKHGLIR